MYIKDNQLYVSEDHYLLSSFIDAFHANLVISTSFYVKKTERELSKLKEKCGLPGFSWGILQ